ncbi:trypsin-like serine peptidase [Staphylococcus delphini]|uniref:trypsin-like serine peptidase n=1 Tax=Staphylococcus delphini TaxID=53344 RepID=UPI001CCB7645|nr:serine protease [Staphylococcus delphini]MBZ8174108.1 serine protease [Staphylococcus delphini]
MKKSFMLKSLSALIILSSVGFVDSSVNETHHVAQAERNVKEIKDGYVAPYSSVVAFVGASGFVVGPNTVVTNKHVINHLKVGDRLSAHPTGNTSKGGNYTITDMIPYSGKEDLAIVHVKSRSDAGWDFNERTTIMPLANSGQAGERVSLIGYPRPGMNKYKLFESTGTVIKIEGTRVIYDAFAEPGTSGGPIVNLNGEAIGVHTGSDIEITPAKKSYGVYFTEDIKKFIKQHIQTQS